MLTYSEAQTMMERARHGRRKLENNTYLEARGGKGQWYIGLGVRPSEYGRLDYWQNVRQTSRPFADGVRVYPDGRMTGAGVDESAVRRQLLKDIRAYVNGFAADAVENGLAYPSSGDCWGCLMRTEANTLQMRDDASFRGVEVHPSTAPGRGDITGASHYLDHLRESYYVPSLLYRAIEAQGFRNPLASIFEEYRARMRAASEFHKSVPAP